MKLYFQNLIKHSLKSLDVKLNFLPLQVVIYVIDVTNSSSLDNLIQWVQAVKSAQVKPSLSAVLGNKCMYHYHSLIEMEILKT